MKKLWFFILPLLCMSCTNSSITSSINSSSTSSSSISSNEILNSFWAYPTRDALLEGIKKFSLKNKIVFPYILSNFSSPDINITYHVTASKVPGSGITNDYNATYQYFSIRFVEYTPSKKFFPYKSFFIYISLSAENLYGIDLNDYELKVGPNKHSYRYQKNNTSDNIMKFTVEAYTDELGTNEITLTLDDTRSILQEHIGFVTNTEEDLPLVTF